MRFGAPTNFAAWAARQVLYKAKQNNNNKNNNNNDE